MADYLECLVGTANPPLRHFSYREIPSQEHLQPIDYRATAAATSRYV